MNFTQMHERLRQELLRRIERGTVSVSLLARQTGLGQSHLSNFLHRRRQLSLEALDRVLAAQHLTAADLLPVLARPGIFGSGPFATRFASPNPPSANPLTASQPANPLNPTLTPTTPSSPPASAEKYESSVPVVSHHAALFEPFIRPSAAQGMLQLPAGLLDTLRPRGPAARRAWERFVAVRIPAADALAMDPLVLPEALALIDRHYNSLIPYRPTRPNLFAIRHNAHLTLRYVDYIERRLVLRPHNLAYPVELIEVDPGESPGDLVAGRIALVLNEV